MQQNTLESILEKWVQVCEHGLECRDCCWPWKGRVAKKGYGKVSFHNRSCIAHALIFKLHHKLLDTDISGRGTIYHLHTCDRELCCNWNHIYQGNHSRNMQDKVDRNRQTKGVEQPHARLNDTKVRQLRRLYHSGGWKQVELAVLFDISQAVCSKLLVYTDWKHLKGEYRTA